MVNKVERKRFISVIVNTRGSISSVINVVSTFEILFSSLTTYLKKCCQTTENELPPNTVIKLNKTEKIHYERKKQVK